MRKAMITLGVLLFTATPVLATTLLWMDVEDLTRNSTSVVMGRVVAQKTLAAQPGTSLNQITLEIDRTLKGDLKGTVTVQNPGFDGAPVVEDGEELILFLYTRDGKHVITGFRQGSFRITTDTVGKKVLARDVPSRDKSVAGDRSVDVLVSEILAAAE